MLRSGYAENAEDREEELRDTNKKWIEVLIKHCKTMGGDRTPLQWMTLCFLDRGGDRARKFSTHAEAGEEFLKLYEGCDVTVLPRDKSTGGYTPPDTMDPDKLIGYGDAVMMALAPFNCVSDSVRQEWKGYRELSPLEVLDVRRDVLQLILSWERIIMTDPVPEHLLTASPKGVKWSPAEKKLMERRGGKLQVPSPTTLMSTPPPDSGRKVSVGRKSSDTSAVVKVSGVPGFIPTSWVEAPKGERLSGIGKDSGMYRDNFQFYNKATTSLKRGKTAFPMMDEEFEEQFGKFYLLVQELQTRDRPSWGLDPRVNTVALIPVIVTGTSCRGQMVGQLGESYQRGLEITELMSPFKTHHVTLSDVQGAMRVTSREKAFTNYAKDPKSTVFQWKKYLKPFDLENSQTWPIELVTRMKEDSKKVVLVARDLTPEGSEEDSDSEDDERTPTPARIPLGAMNVNTILSRGKGNNLKLERYLGELGSGTKCLGDRDTVLMQIIHNSLGNVSTDTASTARELKGLGDNGGLAIPPIQGKADYTAETTIGEKIENALKVGVCSRDTKGNNSLKLCIPCNRKTFEDFFEDQPKDKLSIMLAPGKEGKIEITPDLMKKLQFSQGKSWYCSDCSPGEGEVNSPLLCPAANAHFTCPFTKCGSLLIAPSNGILKICPHCSLCFGGGRPVKPKELTLDTSPVMTNDMVTRQLVAYLSETGRQSKEDERTDPATIQKLLAEAAVSPQSVGGFPRIQMGDGIRHQMVGRGLWSPSGKGGLCLADFQPANGNIPQLENTTWRQVVDAGKGTPKENNRTPVWGFAEDAHESVKVQVIERAAELAFDVLIYIFGDNFKVDKKQAMEAYTKLVYDSGQAAAFPTARKLALLESIFSGFFKRVHKQIDDWSIDQRFPHEIAVESKIRLALYVNSAESLRLAFEPMNKAQADFASSKAAFTTSLIYGQGGAKSLKAKGTDPESEDTFAAGGLDVKAPVFPKPLALGSTGAVDYQALHKTSSAALKAAQAEVEKLKKKAEVAKEKAAKKVLADKEKKEKAKKLAETKAQTEAKAGGCLERRVPGNASSKEDRMIAVLEGSHFTQGINRLVDSPSLLGLGGPRNVQGTPVCPAFQTVAGCCRHPDVPCPLAHEVIPVGCFSPLMQLYFLPRGGHKLLKGEFSQEALKSLLDPNQKEHLMSLSPEMQENQLRTTLHDRLSNLLHPVGTHVSLEALKAGEGVQWAEVWGPNAPFKFSKNGVPVRYMHAVKFGRYLPNGMSLVLAGYVADVGERIALPSGGHVANACFIMALTACVGVPRMWPHILGMQPEYLMLLDLVKLWASIPLEKLLRLPGSRFTSLFVEISKLESTGLPDSFLLLGDISQIPSLCGVHVVIISQSATDPTDFTFRLFLEQSSKLRKQFLGNRDTANLLDNWTVEGERRDLLFSFPVVCIASLMIGEERHAHSFSIPYSLAEFMKFMRRAHLATAAKISVAKCGMNAYLEGETTARVHSEEEIRDAYAAIQSLLQKVVKGVRPDLEARRISKTQGRKDRQEKALSKQLLPIVEKLVNSSDAVYDRSAGSKESKVVSGVTGKQRDRRDSKEAIPADSPAEFTVDCIRCEGLSVAKAKADVCDDCKWVAAWVAVNMRNNQGEVVGPTKAGGVKIANTTLEVSPVEDEVQQCRQCDHPWICREEDAGFVVNEKGKEKVKDDFHCVHKDTENRKSILMTNLEGCEEYKAGSTAEWAKYYDSKFIQLLLTAEAFSIEERLSVVRKLAKFMNKWFYFEVDCRAGEKPSAQLRPALLAIVDALRKIWFSKRLNAGPEWSSIEAEFKGKVPEEQLKLLRSVIEEGGDAHFIGPVKGYKAKVPVAPTPEEEAVVLKDFLKTLFEKKGIVFDYSDPKILRMLIDAGVRMANIVLVEKKTAAGVPTGKLRMCANATDAGHENAANSGQFQRLSQSTQQTTNSAGVVLAAISEEKEHKDCHIRAAKIDIADAFPKIPQPLGLIGCFAAHTPGAQIVLVNFVLVFGGASSPGLWQVPGDMIISALNMTPKVDPTLSGPIHPQVRRFVDDYLSAVAMSGSRCQEHTGAMLKLIRALLGESAVNEEKQKQEGEAGNYAYAFGCVINCQERTVLAPGAKIKKAYEECKLFLGGEEATMTLGSVQRLAGVLNSVLTYAPPLSKIVLPRLHRIMSNAARSFPSLEKLPSDLVVSPCMRDETNEVRAWDQLRYNLRLFFGLASIEKGALLCSTFEGCLPLQVRLTFPGKETRETHIELVSDASKEGFFLMNMRTGEYIMEPLRDEERKVFNSWDLGDKTTQVTINHLENLPCLWGAVMMWGKYPGHLIQQYLDNTAAEFLQLDGKIKSAKDEQIGAIIALIELVMQCRGYGDRVTSKDNLADFFTRAALATKAAEYLRDFEKRTGIKPKKVELPSWLRDMKWGVTEETDRKAWGDIALQVLEHLETEFPKALHQYCRVPIGKVREQFERVCKGLPPSPIPEFVEDFPKSPKLSEERSLLMGFSHQTITNLRLPTKTHEVDSRQLERKVLAPGGSAHIAAIAELNCDFKRDGEVLKNSDPKRLSSFESTLPKFLVGDPQMFSRVVGNELVRLPEDLGLCSFSVGPGSFPTAFHALTGGVPRVCTDPNSVAREHMKDMFPSSKVFASVSVDLAAMKEWACQVGICTFSFTQDDVSGKDTQCTDLNKALDAIRVIQPLGFLMEWPPAGTEEEVKELLKMKLPHYHIQVSKVNMAEVISPISGLQSVGAGQSMFVAGYEKAWFPGDITEMFRGEHPRLRSSTGVLDFEGQGAAAYTQMPLEDQIGFNFNFRLEDGIAMVGEIHDAPKVALRSFPNVAVCPRLGLLPLGPLGPEGGPWIQIECPSQRKGYERQRDASFRRLTAKEVTRALGLRGFTHRKWDDRLGKDDAESWRLVDRQSAQPLYDQAVAAMLLNFSSPLNKESSTPFENWAAAREGGRNATGRSSKRGSGTGSPWADDANRVLWAVGTEGARDQAVERASRCADRGRSEPSPKVVKIMVTPSGRYGKGGEDASGPQRGVKALQESVRRQKNEIARQRVEIANLETSLSKSTNDLSDAEDQVKRLKEESCNACARKRHCNVCANPKCEKAKCVALRRSIQTALKENVSAIPRGGILMVDLHQITPVVGLIKGWCTGCCRCLECSTCVGCGVTDRVPRISCQGVRRAVGSHARGEQILDGGEPLSCTEVFASLVEKEVVAQEILDGAAYATGKKQEAGRNERQWSKDSNPRAVPPIQKLKEQKKFVARSRAPPQLSKEDIRKHEEFAEGVLQRGKRCNTMKGYSSAEDHWIKYFEARGWDPLLKEDSYEEKSKKIIAYISYERVSQQLLGRSIKGKLSGIGAYFIRNFRRNPFHELESVQSFLRDLSSHDPPPDPKVPAPPQLLELLCRSIDESSVGGATIVATTCAASAYMLRSAEYLSPDDGKIDPKRVLTWGDITMRRSLGYEEEICEDENFQDGKAMTLRIVSYKNKKVVSTRTLVQNEKSPICPVKAIKWLHKTLKDHGITPEANRPICQLAGADEFLTRDNVSNLLKIIAEQCGCDPKKLASHSLRRGGACAYAAAGVPDEDIKRFGRWTSDAYKLYIMLSDRSILSKGSTNPALVVTRYEKN